ncbi:hypothetical protein AB0I28_19695 [Phytomonospora sp. NPDC050363]|uniref:hypothetical protein n=1 Tax=Phytomonospora sp. NPDC050363 TaxID=3155642 RepID=UPI003411665E
MAGTDARARVTAVGTVVSVIFGFGGLVTLILLVHRQILQTRAQTHTETVAADAKHDAIQKRAQELFLKLSNTSAMTRPPSASAPCTPLTTLGTNTRGGAGR